MKFLTRFWEDIKSGENIDLYATIVVAFGTAILTLFNINVDSFLQPITLAILGILAVSALVIRKKLDEVRTQVANNSNLAFSRSFPESFALEMETAHEVWILGYALRRTIEKHYSLFERTVKRGINIRFILINPTSHACEIAAAKHFPSIPVDSYRNQMEVTFQQIHTLMKIGKGRVELRVTNIPPNFTMYAINPQSDSGKLYLSYSPFESTSEHRVKFLLTPSNGYAYESFKQELLTHWENAVEWSF